MDMRERIKERSTLAHIMAQDGAYASAARILADLSKEVKAHAKKLDREIAKSRKDPMKGFPWR